MPPRCSARVAQAFGGKQRGQHGLKTCQTALRARFNLICGDLVNLGAKGILIAVARGMYDRIADIPLFIGYLTLGGVQTLRFIPAHCFSASMPDRIA